MLHIVLAQLWIGFCVLHSLFIASYVEEHIKQLLGTKGSFYRLFYVLFSLISFILVYLFEQSLRSELLFTWNSIIYVKYILIVIAIIIAYFGAREYNMLYFVGIEQLRSKEESANNITYSGILSWIRHPFYTATFIFLWTRDISTTSLISSTVLSIYLFVGTIIEERKLIDKHGDEYIAYKQKVSMFVPYKKLLSFIK